MTIQSEDGYFVAECDNCGDTLDTEVVEFYLVSVTLKQHNWATRKTPTGWEHLCGCCVAEDRDARADFVVS